VDQRELKVGELQQPRSKGVPPVEARHVFLGNCPLVSDGVLELRP
jgi:hypothetical protein